MLQEKHALTISSCKQGIPTTTTVSTLDHPTVECHANYLVEVESLDVLKVGLAKHKMPFLINY